MTIAKVQEVSSYTASGGSANKTITITAPTAGNTLILWVYNDGGTGDPTAVSGGGVTWTKTANFGRLSLWTGPNSSGSGTTITVTVANTYSRSDCNVTEWSGMPATLTADGGSNGTSSNPNNVTPSVTPTGTPVLLLAAAYASAPYSAGPTGGFTALTMPNATRAKWAYQIADPASGSYQCGWTNSAGYSTATVGLYAFDGASSGASGVARLVNGGRLINGGMLLGNGGLIR